MTQKVSAEAIKDARHRAGLTQKEAGELVFVARRTWQDWECGTSAIPGAAWQLFQIKTSLMAVQS